MKIEKINLPETMTSKFGLKAVQMERLGNIVLIAGKNGAGKSRLLELIRQNVVAAPKVDLIKDTIEKVRTTEQEIVAHGDVILEEETALNSPFLPETNISHHKLNIKRFKEKIQNARATINGWQGVLKKTEYMTFVPEKAENDLIDFVPKSLTLQDSYTISAQELDRSARNIYSIGTNGIAEGTIPAIEMIQRNWVNANTTTTDDLNITQDEREKIISDYEKLKKYVKLFLNTDLKRTKEGYPEIFNKRIGQAQLSNGQKILLQFCMALYAQEINLENLIILMDEPENHLHPAALIEVLDKIVPHVKNGQIWIATHSINVLAHFDPSCIWYIDNGQISFAGNIPSKVLSGLIGDEDEIEKLSNFLALPAQMAITKFAFESLFYPDVLITGREDHQTNQIYEIIKKRTAQEDKLKILDLGMGKGRLLSAIHENERLRGGDITKWLDFYGYDKCDTYKSICIKILEEIYGNSINRYFNETKDLLAQQDEETFDIVVMCNVFHEIEPKDWCNIFNSAVSPFRLLKPDGYLLIVEDQFLAVGEKAHSKGFLVYDELEFKKLFKITSQDGYKSTDYRGDGRLKSHHIPQKCISRMDAVSKKESFEILLQNSKDEIKKLRQNVSPTFKTGKLHGFWAQQLANVSIAIEEL